MVTLQDHFGCVDPDCLCRADRADTIRPGSVESLPSPSQAALSIPLRDWHSGGRALLPPSPTHQDSNGSPSARNSTSARFRQAGGSSLRQQPASGSKSSHLNDTDVGRWKRNLHRHAAEQKLYFSGMTTEEHFQLNSDNNRTFIAEKQKKKEQQQAALRPPCLRRATTRCMARVSRIADIASPLDTVRKLCDNIRLSGAAMEAAANGLLEEAGEDEIDLKLDKQGALLRAMAENVRGRYSASPARRVGSSRSFLSNISASLGGTMLDFECEGSATVNPDNWVLTEEEMVRLRKAATTLKMSTADVFLIKTIFDSYDLQHTGFLGVADFENVVTELLQAHLHDNMISTERVQKLCEGYWTTWQSTATTQSEEISFDQLLLWYSNTLRANTLVTENDRLRRIAEQWDMEPTAVEHLKRCFDASAKSGCIDISGFKLVLQKALRVPPHNELPDSRVVHFFKSCDDNHSGLVNFEEFLCWWAKYFSEIDGDEKTQDKTYGGEPKKSRLPFEDFYRRIRSTSTMTPDPPAYFNGVLMSEVFREMENGNSSGPSSRVGSKQSCVSPKACTLESLDSTDTTFNDPQACKPPKNRRAQTASASSQRGTKHFQKAKHATLDDIQWGRTASC